MKLVSLAALALLCVISGCKEPVNIPRNRSLVSAHGQGAPVAFLQLCGTSVRPGERVRGGLVFSVWKDGEFVRAAGPGDVGKSYVRGHLSHENRAKLIEAVRNAVPAIPEDWHLPWDTMGYVLTYKDNKHCIERSEWVGEDGKARDMGGKPLGTTSVLSQLEHIAYSIAVNNATALDFVPFPEEDWYRR